MKEYEEKEAREYFLAKAEKVKTQDDLNCLLDEIRASNFDYGGIVIACMAGMIGAFHVVNRSDAGGITGFQAGYIMWECIRRFGMFGDDAILRIVDYRDLMFPQCDYNFTTIPSSSRDKLVAAAKSYDTKNCHPDVANRIKSIAEGNLPCGLEVEL